MTVTLSLSTRIQLEVRKMHVGTEFTAADLAQRIGGRTDTVGQMLVKRMPSGIIPIEPVEIPNGRYGVRTVRQYRRVEV